MLGCVALGSEVSGRGDSGIYGPSYTDILAWQKHLGVAYPSILQLQDYGTSYQGRPLRLMIAMKKTQVNSPRTAVVMTGAIHGNEYLNIEDRLPEELLKRAAKDSPVRDFLEGGGVLVFVPIVNPDGYESRSRYNSRGTDLNRDWDVPPAGFEGFKEKETLALSVALEQLRIKHNLKYAVTVDYHCCAGALLTPWSYSAQDLAAPHLSHHRAIGEMATKELKIVVGATGQVLGYQPTGTSKDYYHSVYKALAFTYEGRYREERNKLGAHIRWWELMLSYTQQKLVPEISLSALSSEFGYNVDL